MKFTPSNNTRKKETLITIEKFDGGYANLIEEARMDNKFAKESTNLMQVSDGLWKTRWGTAYYGAVHSATIDGASEYVKSDGTTELITIANGKAYSSSDGGSVSEISGATFTAGTQCYFLQISGYLYIANGTDPLTRYDGSVLTTYSSIATPTNLTASLVASGLASGSFVYYGQVAALNDVGETVGSTEVSITVNKDRDTWVASTDKGIYWGWTAVSGANRYQFYLSDEQGYETLLLSTTTTNFVDDGTVELNPYVEPPLQNTTAAPKFKSMAVSGNRIWATNDDNDMYRVSFSGTGQNMGNFSDFYGGGWINLEKGGREIPIAVKHYQSGSGTGRATVLCKTPDGQGAVWQISIETATVGSTTFSVPSASKVLGSFGTESINGVVGTTNDIGFPNRRGWFFLGPEKQFYGILRTKEASSLIRPYWRGLRSNKINGVAAYYYDAKIFISVPTTTAGNNKTIVYDTERQNWAVAFSFGAKQFLEYTDTNGLSHFLYVPLSGTKLIEISSSILGDLGVAFNQSYISPLLPISKKETDMYTHNETTVKIGNPTGNIYFEVLGIGKDGTFSSIESSPAQIQSLGSNTGIGADLPSGFYPSSTRTSANNPTGSAWVTYLLDAPEVFTQATIKRTIRKRAQLYAIQYHIYSSDIDSSFTIHRIQSKGQLVSRKAPSSWSN